MKDYTFSFKAASEYSSEETTFKLVCRTDDFFNGKIPNFKWDVFLNDQPTDWTITKRSPDAYTSYWDLELDGELIHTYEFDMLSYLPNLMKIYNRIAMVERNHKLINS